MGQGKFEKKGTEQSRNPAEQKQEKQMSWQQNTVLYLHDLVYLLAAIMLAFILLFRIVIVGHFHESNFASWRLSAPDEQYLLPESTVW